MSTKERNSHTSGLSETDLAAIAEAKPSENGDYICRTSTSPPQPLFRSTANLKEGSSPPTGRSYLQLDSPTLTFGSEYSSPPTTGAPKHTSKGTPLGLSEMDSSLPWDVSSPESGLAPSALDKQIGGSHYKKMKIQPVEFIHANDIGFIEGCIIKYTCRWKDKGGTEDLEKVIHYAQMLIDLESN